MDSLNDCSGALDIAVSILNDLLSYEKLESGILQTYCDYTPAVPLIRRAIKIFDSQVLL